MARKELVCSCGKKFSVHKRIYKKFRDKVEFMCAECSKAWLRCPPQYRP